MKKNLLFLLILKFSHKVSYNIGSKTLFFMTRGTPNSNVIYYAISLTNSPPFHTLLYMFHTCKMYFLDIIHSLVPFCFLCLRRRCLEERGLPLSSEMRSWYIWWYIWWYMWRNKIPMRLEGIYGFNGEKRREIYEEEAVETKQEENESKDNEHWVLFGALYPKELFPAGSHAPCFVTEAFPVSIHHHNTERIWRIPFGSRLKLLLTCTCINLMQKCSFRNGCRSLNTITYVYCYDGDAFLFPNVYFAAIFLPFVFISLYLHNLWGRTILRSMQKTSSRHFLLTFHYAITLC